MLEHDAWPSQCKINLYKQEKKQCLRFTQNAFNTINRFPLMCLELLKHEYYEISKELTRATTTG